MAYGWLLRAEYESGFVLLEDEADHSPYDPGRNVFHAIANGRPTAAGHGRLVRFSLIGTELRYDLDWATLPAGARPVYYRLMRHSFLVGGGGQSSPVCESHHFGWQASVDGADVQEVIDVSSGS